MHPRQHQRTNWQRAKCIPCSLEIENPLLRLAEDLIDLAAEGAAVRERLIGRGYSEAYLDANLADAGQMTNVRFVRQVEHFDDQGARIDRAAHLAADLISESAMVAHLMANGYIPAELKTLLPAIIQRLRELLGAHEQLLD